MTTTKTFTFEAWIKFESKKDAAKALREMTSVHADLCSHVRKSQLIPGMVKLRAADAESVKRIMRFFESAESCGWNTTDEEKRAAGISNEKPQKRTQDGQPIWLIEMTDGQKFRACGPRETLRREFNESAELVDPSRPETSERHKVKRIRKAHIAQ